MKRLHITLALVLTMTIGGLGIASASATTSGADIKMRIRAFTFVPNNLTLAPGQTIGVFNADGVNHGIPHSVTAIDGSFDTEPFLHQASLTAPLTPGKYVFR